MTRGRVPGRGATVLVAAAGCLLGPLSPCARAAARATIRVDQVGYQESAPKRAYVLSSRPEAGAGFTVVNQSSTVVLSGSVGPALGSWSRRAGEVYPIDFDSLGTPGTYTIVLAGKTPATSPPFTLAPAAQLYPSAAGTRAELLRERARRPRIHPLGAALGARPPQRRERDDLHDAESERRRGLQGRTAEPRRKNRRLRWLVGRRRLSEVRRRRPATRSRCSWPGCATFPADGRRGGLLGLHRRGPLRRRMAAEDVERQHAHALLPGRDRLGQRRSRRRPRHLAPAPGRRRLRRLGSALPLHPRTPRVPGRACPEPPSAPTSPAATPPRSRSARRCSPPPARTGRTLPDGRRAHLRTGGHRPAGQAPDGHSRTASTPRPNGATTWSWGPPSSRSRWPAPNSLPGGLPHTEARFYLERAAHWASAYISQSGSEGEALNLYDVSGLADFELVRAMREQGEPGGAGGHRSRPASGTSPGNWKLLGRSRSSDPFGFGFPWAEADTASHGDGLSVMASEYDSLTGGSTLPDALAALARRTCSAPTRGARRSSSATARCSPTVPSTRSRTSSARSTARRRCSPVPSSRARATKRATAS